MNRPDRGIEKTYGARSDRELVFGHPLFADVQAEHAQCVLDNVAVKTVSKGNLLNTPEVRPGLLHLVLLGRLRAYQMTIDGHELLLELIPEGGFDGLLSAAGRRGHFTEADADSVVASLARPALEKLMMIDPRIAANLLDLIVERLESREGHLETMALHDPTRRLAAQFMALCQSLGRTHGSKIALTPRITHQMLSDMLGVRRETVTLHLGHLADLGAVSVQRGRFLIRVDVLKRIIDDPRYAVRQSRTDSSALRAS